ncbi:MAG: hypothetical protein ACI8Y7_000456 [Candidatus Woesearchaeota archaeon]|jgi:hypothetical protein
MFFDFVTSEMRKLDTPAQKRAYVAEALPKLKDPILWCGYNPKPFAKNDKTNTLKVIFRQRRAIQTVEKLYGPRNPAPEYVRETINQVVHNICTTRELFRVNGHDEENIWAHKLFPLAANLDKQLKALFQGKADHITFTDEYIGNGTFATVLHAMSKNRILAVKLFHDPRANHVPKSNARYETVQNIAENLEHSKEITKQSPFVQIRHIAPHQTGLPFAYIADYFSGINLEDLFSTVEPETFEEYQVQADEVIRTYTGMLELIHKKDFVFCDNNLGAILINPTSNEVRICDYDHLQPLETEGKNVYTPGYASFEQSLGLPQTKLGDIEGFCRIVDRIGNRDSNREEKNSELTLRRLHELAQINYTYDSKRANHVKPNLKQIVCDTLTYPRDDSITTSDLVSAVKEDYRM